MTGGFRSTVAGYLAGIFGWIAARSSSAAFRIADGVAFCTTFARRGPTHARMRQLFPEMSASQRASAIRSIWRTQVRHFLVLAIARRSGVGALAPLIVEPQIVSDLQPPVIVATFHTGPVLALGAVAERCDARVLGLRSADLGVPRAAHVSIHFDMETEEQRAASFVAAHRSLREGGFVFMAVDPMQSGGMRVPFFDGTLRLARGAFALTRMTGVPIVPVIARWEGDRIAFRVGKALSASDEQQTAVAAASWLESHLRQSPELLSNHLLELTAPEA